MRPSNFSSNFNFNINFVQNFFGVQASGIYKRWINFNFKLIKVTSQVQFLKNCKMNKVIPIHLHNLYKMSFTQEHFKTAHKLEKVIYNTQIKILNIEIFELHRQIYVLNKELMFLSMNLSNHLPPHIYNKIIYRYSDMFHRFRYRSSIKYRDKLIWLKRKKNDSSFKNIKPIRYSCLIEGNDRKDNKGIKFILSDNVINSEVSKIEINIKPEKFADLNIDFLNH